MAIVITILFCVVVVLMLFKNRDEKDYDDYVQWWELNISSFSDHRLREEAADLEELVRINKAKPGAKEILNMIKEELKRRGQ